MPEAALSLTRIELREIRLPLVEPFRISSGIVSERRILLLELTDGIGRHGVGGVRGRRAAELQPRDDRHRLAGDPRVAGAAPARTRQLRMRRRRWRRCSSAGRARPPDGEGGAGDGLLGARGGARAGCSLAALLGGTRDAHRHRRSRSGSSRSPEALVERVAQARARWATSGQAEDRARADVEYVRAVREALGPDAPLMADANSAYSLADADHLARLDDLGLRYSSSRSRPTTWCATPSCSGASAPRSASTSRSPRWTARRT